MSFEGSIERSFKSSSSQLFSSESHDSGTYESNISKDVSKHIFTRNSQNVDPAKEDIYITEPKTSITSGFNRCNKRALYVFNENTQKEKLLHSEDPQCKKIKLDSRAQKEKDFLSFWSRIRDTFPQNIRLSIPKENSTQIHEWIKKNSSGLETIKSLNLCGLGLTAIPDEIKYLTSLSILDASLNKMTSIAEEVYNLTNLEILSLEDNQLEEISPSISKLTQLEELILIGNVLEALPNEIERLANLRILKLGNNYIQEMPKSLKGLGNLRELSLDSNELQDIPLSLTELPSLEVLDVKNNSISAITDQLVKLKSLKHLNIEKNHIQLHELFSIKNLQSIYY